MKVTKQLIREVRGILNLHGWTGYRKEVASRVTEDGEVTWNYELYEETDLEDLVEIGQLAGEDLEFFNGTATLDVWLYHRDDLVTQVSVYIADIGNGCFALSACRWTPENILRAAVAAHKGDA